MVCRWESNTITSVVLNPTISSKWFHQKKAKEENDFRLIFCVAKCSIRNAAFIQHNQKVLGRYVVHSACRDAFPLPPFSFPSLSDVRKRRRCFRRIPITPSVLHTICCLPSIRNYNSYITSCTHAMNSLLFLFHIILFYSFEFECD